MKLISAVILIGFAGGGRIDAQQGDFWPMQVGNVWEYKHLVRVDYERLENGEVRFDVETIQVILSIDATESIDGRTYFRFSNGQLLRKDEAGNVFEYLEFEDVGGDDYLMLNFFPLDGEETPAIVIQIPYFPFPPEGHPAILSGGPSPYPQQRHWVPDRTLELPFDSFTGFFSFNYSLGEAEGYAYVFVQGSGLVSSSQGSDTPVLNRYELVRATIDGVDIPTVIESSRSWGAVKNH